MLAACASDAAVPIAGLYHLAELQVASANLRVDTDGTFRWAIDGCDFFGGDRGVWTSDGVALTLRSATAGQQFMWMGPSSGKAVTSVTLAPSTGTDISAMFTVKGAGAPGPANSSTPQSPPRLWRP